MTSPFETEVDLATDGSVGVTVVRAVAAVEGIHPNEVSPPLGERLDLDALDTLVCGRPSGSHSGDSLEVAFTYCGYRVTIIGGGTVRLAEQ